MVLRILDRRGIDISGELRERITGCTNLDRLDTWADRALTANHPDDLLD